MRLRSGILGIFVVVTILSARIVFSSENIDSNWTYSAKNGIEKSKRTYLLVSEPGTKEEKQFKIVSTCEKQLHSESKYGVCGHQINNKRDKAKFTLTTGEDVVMVSIVRDVPLIIATIEYGCCAGPDIIRFYTDRGHYLGLKEEYTDRERYHYPNVFTRLSNFGYGPFYGGRSYLLVHPDEKSTDLKAVVWESGRLIGTIPVNLSISNRELCPVWTIEEFDGYRDEKSLTLTIKGYECDEGDRIYSCSVSAEKMTCLPKTTTPR